MTPTTAVDMTLVWAVFGPEHLVNRALCVESLPPCGICAPIHVHGHIADRIPRARYRAYDPVGHLALMCRECWEQFGKGPLGPTNQFLFLRHENVAILIPDALTSVPGALPCRTSTTPSAGTLSKAPVPPEPTSAFPECVPPAP